MLFHLAGVGDSFPTFAAIPGIIVFMRIGWDNKNQYI
jgi:hypothetical protein